MEFIDIFDVNYNHLGQEEKTKAHLEGLWHQVFHCWFVKPGNKVLLQLRGKDKDVYPNLLDISAAGHISAGEAPIEGIREIKEELGISVDEKQLKYLGSCQEAFDIMTPKGLFHNNEFVHMYFLKDETPLQKYKLQAEEVDGVYEIDIEDGLKLFSDEVTEITIKGYNRITGREENIKVGQAGFVGRSKFYYLKLFIMAQRFIAGERYIGF